MIRRDDSDRPEKSVLVTGCGGFIGNALCLELVRRNFKVFGVARAPCHISQDIQTYQIDDLSPSNDWSSMLSGKDVVVHLAARAHVLEDERIDAEDLYMRTNFLATVNLANQAVRAGVKRFVFISTIGVNGSSTKDGEAIDELSDIKPHNSYAKSKWLAEQVLNEIALSSAMEVVILRPTLVYGPEPKGNFYALLKLVKSGLPLPFGRVANLRSFIYLGNLVDIVITCIQHPKAAGNTYVLSDGEDLSTANLMRVLSRALKSKSIIFSVPEAWLGLCFKLLGKSHMFEKLSSSLVVDSRKVRKDLSWLPPYTLSQGINAVALWFVKVEKIR